MLVGLEYSGTASKDDEPGVFLVVIVWVVERAGH